MLGNRLMYSRSFSWPLDISEAFLEFNKDITTDNGFEEQARGIFISPDGLKLFCMTSSRIYQYTLNYSWDISSVVDDNVYFKPVESEIDGIFFDPTGTKMYFVGFFDSSYQYSLSIPWDLSSTVTRITSLDLPDYTYPLDSFISPNGVYYYIAKFSGGVQMWVMSTPWSLASATFTASTVFTPITTYASGLSFNPSGTKMYIMDAKEDAGVIYQYSLSTPWYVNTASYDSKSLDISSNGGMFSGMFINDKAKFFCVNDDGDYHSHVYYYRF